MRAAFLHGGRSPQLQAIFHEQARSLRRRINAMNADKARALFQELRAAGLRESPLGLDFTSVQARRYPVAPADVLLDGEVRSALELLVFPVDGLARTFWARDQPARGQGATASSDAPSEFSIDDGLLRSLRGGGFARVGNWSAYGLDFDALAKEAGAAMRRAELNFRAAKSKVSTKATIVSFEPLRALRPLLHNRRLARVVTEYIGGPARYDGHKLVTLTNESNERNYASSVWHHDRCGRRLKLFIFLHDVTPGGRPTSIAHGSHNTIYYTFGNPWNLLSRYSDAWVRAQYPVTSMYGPQGGGFLFDTNSLHRGEATGERSRLTVILEFHGHGKVHQLSKYNNPCPSSKARSGLQWEHGVPHLREYPVELWLGQGVTARASTSPQKTSSPRTQVARP